MSCDLYMKQTPKMHSTIGNLDFDLRSRSTVAVLLWLQFLQLFQNPSSRMSNGLDMKKKWKNGKTAPKKRRPRSQGVGYHSAMVMTGGNIHVCTVILYPSIWQGVEGWTDGQLMPKQHPTLFLSRNKILKYLPAIHCEPGLKYVWIILTQKQKVNRSLLLL